MIFNPANLIIAVSGDFDEETMLKTLDGALAGWPKGARVSAPPETPSAYTPAIYYVDQDVPQGGVIMGLRSIRRDDPDLAAAEIMNDILGGGGFSSRITKRVRSDEGLAYSAGSRLAPGTWDDGTWGASFQSKSPTVALAIDLILNEMAGIRDGEVTDEEMDVAKGSIIETFPTIFQSKHGTVSVFAADELTGRDPGFWTRWRDQVRAVTRADVRRVANRLLDDDALAIVIVGDWGEIDAGDADGRASMSAVTDRLGFAAVELPLRDPLTMEPMQ
jgi:predicted Zn-dependent peptidase